MANINDLIDLTRANRKEDADRAKSQKALETSSKMREATMGAFLTAAKGMLGSTKRGARSTRLLGAVFGVAALGKTLADGITQNWALSEKPQKASPTIKAFGS